MMAFKKSGTCDSKQWQLSRSDFAEYQGLPFSDSGIGGRIFSAPP
jgi:hypothetical protein